VKKRPNNATVVEACTQRVRALGSYVDGSVTIAINARKHGHPDVVAIYGPQTHAPRWRVCGRSSWPSGGSRP
jgi:hypothetical protein